MTAVIVKRFLVGHGSKPQVMAEGLVMTSAAPDGPPAFPPRERMVRSAAQLIRRKGVSGTGMREIVSEANAPRGSLQHYFPGGKEELVAEALLWMGGVAA